MQSQPMNKLVRYTVHGIPFTVVVPDSAEISDKDAADWVKCFVHADAVITSVE